MQKAFEVAKRQKRRYKMRIKWRRRAKSKWVEWRLSSSAKIWGESTCELALTWRTRRHMTIRVLSYYNKPHTSSINRKVGMATRRSEGVRRPYKRIIKRISTDSMQPLGQIYRTWLTKSKRWGQSMVWRLVCVLPAWGSSRVKSDLRILREQKKKDGGNIRCET